MPAEPSDTEKLNQRFSELFRMHADLMLYVGAMRNVLRKHKALPSDELDQEIRRLQDLAKAGVDRIFAEVKDEDQLKRLRKLLDDIEGPVQ